MTDYSKLLWSAISVLPLAGTAAAFLSPVLRNGTTLWGTSVDQLTSAMQMEFLVIGGGLLFMPFLMLPAESRTGNRVRGGLFFLFSFGFAVGTYQMDGLGGVARFYFLLIVGYGGSVFFMKELREQNRLAMELGLRWVLNLVIFFGFFALLEPPQRIESWRGNAELLRFGAAFFGTLFILEVTVLSWATPKLHRIISGEPSGTHSDRHARIETLRARRETKKQG